MKNIKREMFKKLGETLFQESVRMKKHAHNVKAETMSSGQLRFLLAEKGLLKIRFADRKYWYVNKKTMVDIIKYDWTDKRKYLSERYDCDDFADTFQSHLREIFGINTVGVLKSIEWVDPKTGKHINWHRANLLLIENSNNEKEIYIFEPQEDILIRIIKGKDIIIWGKKWILNDVEF